MSSCHLDFLLRDIDKDNFFFQPQKNHQPELSSFHLDFLLGDMNEVLFLATLVAPHFTPVVGGSVGGWWFRTSVASRLVNLFNPKEVLKIKILIYLLRDVVQRKV